VTSFEITRAASQPQKAGDRTIRADAFILATVGTSVGPFRWAHGPPSLCLKLGVFHKGQAVTANGHAAAALQYLDPRKNFGAGCRLTTTCTRRCEGEVAYQNLYAAGALLAATTTADHAVRGADLTGCWPVASRQAPVRAELEKIVGAPALTSDPCATTGRWASWMCGPQDAAAGLVARPPGASRWPRSWLGERQRSEGDARWRHRRLRRSLASSWRAVSTWAHSIASSRS